MNIIGAKIKDFAQKVDVFAKKFSFRCDEIEKSSKNNVNTFYHSLKFV